jgi:membrane-associated phospholipid phosphatase
MFLKKYMTSNIYYVYKFLNDFAEPLYMFAITVVVYLLNYLIFKTSLRELKFKFILQLKVILSSGLIVQLFKFAIGRYRFKEYLKCGNFGFEPFLGVGYSNSSFPSGHSSSIFTFVTILLLLFYVDGKTSRVIKIFAYSFATLVAFSRLILRAHYLSDVIAGSLLGIICAEILFRFFNKEEKKLTS